jgi:L-lactate dehydrogenase complex protein LldF
VKINIPEVLIELRARVVDEERHHSKRLSDPMYLGMKITSFIFQKAWRFHMAQSIGRVATRMFTGRDGWIHSLPNLGGKWTQTRDLRGLPNQTFHEWWKTEKKPRDKNS